VQSNIQNFRELDGATLLMAKKVVACNSPDTSARLESHLRR
jgi:hypothetical protein